MNIQIFQNEQDFLKAALAFLPQPKAKIAISGGQTPKAFYKAIPDSDQFEFYQLDERYVPSSDQDSNYQIQKHFKNLHQFDTSLSIEDSLQKYSEEIKDVTFDLAILGIGPDGHIASLFPHSPALHTDQLTAHTTTDTFATHDRLTITLPKILSSKKILVLLKNKPSVLEELKNPTKSPDEFPAHYLGTASILYLTI
ncbi:MAG: 6-phosphogluconolactonase [Candidatus Gracilibacteria bacterium]